MATSNRASQFIVLQKALKKEDLSAIAPDAERPIIEHLLFGACLENAMYEAAEECFAALENNFIDWNEVRVTTVRELAETLSSLPDAEAVGDRVRRILQHVFETYYSFDLEPLRKQNLGPASDALLKIDGVTPFIASYVIQSALGGHAIPIDHAAVRLLFVMDLITAKNAETGAAPGLERAIPKTKGVEFGSLLHQVAVRFSEDTADEVALRVIAAVNPDAAAQLQPKPKAAKKKAAAPKKKAAAPKKKTAAPKKKAAAPKKTAAPKKKAAKTAPAKKTTKKTKKATKKLAKSKPR